MMWGYTLAFGPDHAGIIGGLENLFLRGIGVNSLSGTIPTYGFSGGMAALYGSVERVGGVEF